MRGTADAEPRTFLRILYLIMGTRERIQRNKDKVYNGILNSAMEIIKNEGLEALSVRKIADKIEYSATVIYSYFFNKEAILIELSRKGFASLVDCVKRSLNELTDPKVRMETLMLAHVRFAKKESELYQLMYTVGIHDGNIEHTFPALKDIRNIFRKELSNLTIDGSIDDDTFRHEYLTFLSIAHGLATLNLYFKDIDPATNSSILRNVVNAIAANVESE